jgi:hypothetical protein
MGLTPIDEAEWLAPSDKHAFMLAAKHDLLATRHADVFRIMPEADSASRELLALLADHLPHRYPTAYGRNGDQITNRTTAEAWDIAATTLHPLDLCGRLIEDDLCLMQSYGDSYRLIGASLCAPNRWRLHERLGQPLAAIHAPVPGYEPALHRPVEHFFAALKPDRIVARVNWGIADDPSLYQPVGRDADAAITRQDAGTKLWLRVERQTLRRLPHSGTVLFTIRTELSRLDDVIATPADATDLAGALREMTPAMRCYKHLDSTMPALLAWLDARSSAAAFP